MNNGIKKSLITLILLTLSNASLSATVTAATKPLPIPPRPTKAIKQYISTLVKKYNFDQKTLTNIMSHAQYDPKVIEKITHPFEKKPWNFYHRYFIRPDRIKNAVIYWHQNQKILDKISAQYGVPAHVIIAIIGIESYFGQKKGTYNELNALTTLGFYYPRRSKFFRKELTEFLLLTRHEKLATLTLKGSYAGALGIPQFMPSSYRYYGIDYSKNNSIDLFTNHEDAIASIANYLKKSGWKHGQPVAIPALIKNEVPTQLVSQTARPKYRLSQLRRYGVRPVEEQPKSLKTALIAMKNTDSSEYWLVFKNFHAIMKYNPRTTYALAVYQLSNAIKEAYNNGQQLTQKSLPTPPARTASRSRSTVPGATPSRPQTG